MRRIILVAALAVGLVACGASDNGGTVPVPNRSSTSTSTSSASSTLPGGG